MAVRSATLTDNPATKLSLFPSQPSHYSKFSFHSISLRCCTSTPALSLKSPLHRLVPFLSTTAKKRRVNSTAETVTPVTEEEETEQSQKKTNPRRKLFVLNLPWSFSVNDIKNLFRECGTVYDVEIIKQKDGKNRGFAFVTMATWEGAQAVIDKFDSHELSGRIIRVEYAKRFKKPKPPSTISSPPPAETRHKLYVTNLAWKVRSNNLRELFSANFNPVSARVIFDSPSGRSAGYGFVSFATREEAEAAMSALNEKELLGRPIRLKYSEKNVDGSESTEVQATDDQPEES